MTGSNDIVEVIISVIIFLLFLPIFSSLLSAMGVGFEIGAGAVLELVKILLYALIVVVVFSAIGNLFD